MEIHIAIVDDKPINRQTLRQKLFGYNELVVDFEASNGLDFLEKLEAAARKPDIILIDLEMPEIDGIETIMRASLRFPELRFIVVTIFEDSNRIFNAIKIGASGYLLKDDSAIDLVEAITNVYEHNYIPMSPSVARKAMDLLRMLPESPEPGSENPVQSKEKRGITKREMEVLKHLASGKNYKAIGQILFISPLTVRKHVVKIYDKLHVNSRTEIINIAHQKKWI